jgi:hypothetical protein
MSITTTPAGTPSIPETAIQLFSEAEVNKFGLAASALARLQKQVSAVTITTAEEAARVQEVLAESKRALKTCEETRLAQTKPLRDQQATINNTWGVLTAAVSNLIGGCEAKIKVWNGQERMRVMREEQAAREAAEKAAREAEAARAKAAELAAAEVDDAEARQAAYEAELEAEAQQARAEVAMQTVEQAPRGIKTESGTTSSLWRSTFKVSDEEKVPRPYLSVDEKKIRAAIAAGVTHIPGVEIWQEEVLRTVTR